MSLIGRLSKGLGVETQAAVPTTQVVETIFGGLAVEGTISGESVTVPKALSLPPVFKAIRIISETGGALPLISYRRKSETDRERIDTRTAELLHKKPNAHSTAVEFWTTALAHLEGWGNAYIGKSKRGGRVTDLHLIEPDRIRLERLRNGEVKFHEYLRGGGTRPWTSRDIIHVRLFSIDGLTGISPISLQRETLGVSLAMRRQSAQFFNDAAIPSGTLNVKEEIKNPEVRERLRKEWKQKHQGKRDIAVLDAGAKFEQVSISMADAQFVEMAGLSRTDIADIFNLPASAVEGSTGNSMTYGNKVSDRQAILSFTLHNPLKKFEQAISNDTDLYPSRDEYCEFLREDWLQPDARAKADIYRFALNPQSGWMTRAEVRARENLPAEENDPTQGDF